MLANSKYIPRVIIAGTNSGCGKTTVTCAVLQCLVNRGIKIASFKCGPDYIDPMFHEKIIGTKGSNLDPFFCNNNALRYLLAKNSSDRDISVIEGVMGYYDGMSLNTTAASTYEASRITDSPVILCINCAGMANSALAVILGFREFKPDNNIAGVIFNNISKTTYEAIKSALDPTVKVFGYLPKLPSDLILESRHLGLITVDEIVGIKEKLQKLAAIAADTLDIDAIIRLADTAPDIEYEPVKHTYLNKKVKIGVAYDSAFCFYYRDNLDLLCEIGAELVYFSPVHDKILPDVDGLYFGGGYPELYAAQLSKNKSMLLSVKNSLEKHIPCIAECGGFMYLSCAIDDEKTVGYLGGIFKNTGKLSRFGYVTLTAKCDNLLCKAGENIRGHEFHYYDSDKNGDYFIAEKTSGKSWDCVHSSEYLYAGFPHLHFYSNIKFAESFINKCIEGKKHDRYETDGY